MIFQQEMNHQEHIKTLFQEGKKSYLTLKTEITAQVVRWFWATNNLFELEPFYFEQNRYPKGKILKETPENPEGKVRYGIDKDENIIVEERYNKFGAYETFYFRSDNEIIACHFHYSESKNLINAKKYVYEVQFLTAIYSFFEEETAWEQFYFYENGKLVRQSWKGEDYHKNPFERTIEYAYNDLGLLKTISENGYLWYQKPEKKLSYKKLSEMVAEKLLPLVKNAIKNKAPQEKLYCINLSYGAENIIPPSIGFGTESDRLYWIENQVKYEGIIWNVADYSFQEELDFDEETARLFDIFNQETELNEKYTSAEKIIVECAKQIKVSLNEFDLDTTEDFVVVAGYFDQSDFTKNFKKINPEKVKEFAKLLI